MEYGNGEKNQLIWKNIDNKYHNEHFDADENNINVNVSMLSKYVSKEDIVLDIGCGEGKFGEVVAQKGCNLWGVDIDQTACKETEARGKYKKVFCFNIEHPEQNDGDYDEFKNLNILFDKIALIDILEHVINPTAVISNAIRYLKNEGKMLISVPNVNNADIFLNLLRDRFNYREDGVLDNTHTKYFTKRSFIEWIQEINELFNFSLDCNYIGSTFAYTAYMDTIKREKPNLFRMIELNPYFHVIQHLFILTYHKEKAETPNLDKLLKESVIDLSDSFENILSGEADANDELLRISLLPNERVILEEKVESAQKGWVKCSQELEKAKEKIEEQEEVIKRAKEFEERKEYDIQVLEAEVKRLREERLSGKADASNMSLGISMLPNERVILEEKVESAQEGWIKCSQELEKAKEKIEEQEEVIKRAKEFEERKEYDIQILKAEVERLREENTCITLEWKKCMDTSLREKDNE